MKNLYVGNLPHSTTESELRSAFEAHEGGESKADNNEQSKK